MGIVIGVVPLLLAATPASAAAQRLPISSVCVDATTGTIVHEENADLVRPPASVVKLMVLLLVAEGLEAGDWAADTPIFVSESTERVNESQIYLAAGEVWALEEMALATAVGSANDASTALAESLWGSVEGYLEFANARAQELGMANTTIRTPHGLPPARGKLPDQTTARDVAMLARACIDNPRVMEWTGAPNARARDGFVSRRNTNRLLRTFDGCDGLKTGFIRAAGYCLAATAERDGTRFVSVVLGAPSSSVRFETSAAILEDAFAAYTTLRLAEGGERLRSLDVLGGESDSISIAAADAFAVTVPRHRAAQVRLVVDAPEPLIAPVRRGDFAGTLRAMLDDDELGHIALHAVEPVRRAGWFLVVRNGRAHWEGLPEAAVAKRAVAADETLRVAQEAK